ncbi:MAG: protein kinase [Myxococcota bacterium]|nr:protein kinase [Myxococcota bacterium]
MGRRSFGKYRLVEKIAIGGMAEVWRAKQTVVEGVERDVVIKRILPHLVNDPDFVQMFLNEARVAARFNHSNVAQIYDVGEVRGAYFIAMEYVAGADLGRVMRKAWSMGHWVARPLAMRILACCCEGLAYAHTRNDEHGKPLRVVHRDISPANILISVDGAVKLTDFGIAKASDLVSVTKAGSIKGKFAYMSPEQACGKPLDHRADLYSAALVLYELLTGIRPLRRDTDAATHAAAVQGEIQAPSEVSDVPAELDSLVMRALAKRPQDRYPDVHAFRMALEEFLVDQRWVATSSQIAELMRILFPDGVQPELPPGVSQEDDFPELGLEDAHHRAAKITSPSRRPSLAERPPAGTDPANFEEPEEEAPQRDLYGEEDPLPDQDPALRVSGGLTAPAPKVQWSGPPRRLDFVEGPDEGMVVRLTAARLVVGRVADCHVNLKDRSISRRHLELCQSDEGVMLRDLASGNGTRVNGEDVTDRLLRHGDVVELGNTRFQFIDEEEDQRLADAQISAKLALEGRKPAPVPSPPPEAQPPAALPPVLEPALSSRWHSLPRRARQTVIGAGGAVVLLGGGLCISSLGPASPEPKQELAQRRLVQARAALSEGRREEAAALAASAERLWPGSDEAGLGLRARRDQDAAERLRKAELALSAGELEGATAVLAEANPAAPELSSQKQSLLGRLEAARQKTREVAFGEAVSAGDFLQARALLTGFSGVQASQLGARLLQAERQATLDASHREAMAAEARVEEERRAKEARAARVEALFRTVDLRLQAADYARAVLAADHVVDANPGDEDVRARAQLLKRVIPTFGRAYDQAQLEERNGQHERAARSLRRTRELLRELGFGGALAETLQRHQVETNLAAALRAVEEKRLTDAALLYREAVHLAPRDRRAQDGLRALAPVADDLYREAQVIKVTNPAQAQDRLRTVLAITEPDSALHARARKALRDLNRLTSGDPE